MPENNKHIEQHLEELLETEYGLLKKLVHSEHITSQHKIGVTADKRANCEIKIKNYNCIYVYMYIYIYIYIYYRKNHKRFTPAQEKNRSSFSCDLPVISKQL